MLECTNKQLLANAIHHFDAFCRTITFTGLPLNKGQVRPK